jgi:hypothetical protein
MKTQSDRTLFFDLLPLDLGEIMGFKTRFLLYTVPGQVFYNATRKLVLKGADGVVFVADSERGKMEDNAESLSNLRANLIEYGVSIEDLPWVLQYNKRDAKDIYSIEEMNQALNPDGAVPWFEAVAKQGQGVFETFRGVSHLLMEKVMNELRRTPGVRSTRPAESGRASDAAINALGPPSTADPAEFGPDLDLGDEAPASAPLPPPKLNRPEPAAGGRTPSGVIVVEPQPSSQFPMPDMPDRSSAQFAMPDRPSGEFPIPGRPSLEPPAALEPADTKEDTPSELVVPVTLPRGATREIVLRIVISDGR